MKILILCTGNSCRSQMAEGFLKYFDNTLEVYSAGTNPAKAVHPKAIEAMKEIGIDISDNFPKSVNQFLNDEFDFVITVCGGAKKNCPVFSGKVKNRLHIGFDDPAEAMGTEDEILSEFRKVRDEIEIGIFEFYKTNIKTTETNSELQFCDINAKNHCCSLEIISEKDIKSHWDNAYENAEINMLGWYENAPKPSLQLIHDCDLDKGAALLNVGAGATTLVDELFKLGYKNIIANDISSVALEKLKNRIGAKKNNIKWILDDLTQPNELDKIGQVDLWHDRAVLHFFTHIKEQDAYFNLLKKLVKPNGYVIIATFNLDGAEKCSGLPVYRYDKKMLQEKLGYGFDLIEAFDYTYRMPSGETREYVYTLFKRKS